MDLSEGSAVGVTFGLAFATFAIGLAIGELLLAMRWKIARSLGQAVKITAMLFSGFGLLIESAIAANYAKSNGAVFFFNFNWSVVAMIVVFLGVLVMGQCGVFERDE